jgi:transcriptional regulator with XRE-family HTH domain
VQKLTNLRHLREHAALTQAETAEHAGIAESTYRYIENLEVSPRPQTVRKIAGALGVEPHELWESEVPKAPAPTSSHKETDEERRANTFDMVHDAVVRQAKEERQAFARAVESQPLVQNISQQPENEVFKQLVQLPRDQLADLSIDIMKYAVQLELEQPQREVAREQSEARKTQR